MEKQNFRAKLHNIIFESDTVWGRRFDLWLLSLILMSVILVVLETVPSLHDRYFDWLYAAEWVFTILFTLEYLVRLYVVKSPWRYATSTLGLIDLICSTIS